MAEQIFIMAGTRFFISEEPATASSDITEADFADTVWVEVRGLYNVGELGSEQAINEFELLDEVWMRKAKGTRNGGTMTNQFIPIADDPGQLKFQEAIEDNCNVYQFKVERGAGCAEGETLPAGLTDLFQGFALDGARSGGSKNDLYTRTFSVAVDGPVITPTGVTGG